MRFHPATNRVLAAASLVAAAVLVTGCGFQLRGVANLPYETMYVDLPPSSLIGAELKRTLRAGTKTRIVEDRSEAEAVLIPVREARTKIILSLSSSGRVREFRLRYAFEFRVADRQGRDLIAPVILVIERDFPFNDSQVLAKETEEALQYRDMQSDMVQQVLRRIEASERLKSG